MASWRKLKNSAAPAIQAAPPRQTIHQHGTNWPLVIIAGVVSIPLTLWIVWAFLAFLFWMMGFDASGHQAASAVFWLLVVAIIGIISREILGYIIGKWFDGKRELQELINDGLRHQQLTAQTGLTTSRQSSDDARLVKLIMVIMWHAYDFYSKYGEYTANDQKPWSRRSIAALTIAGESKPVGETIINSKAKRFLEREGVITDNAARINVDDYPNLDSIRELLARRFDVPVKFYGRIEANGSLPNSGYGFGQDIQK